MHEYLMSRDAVRRLEREDDLRMLLTRPEGDFVSRFPGLLFWRRDFEALFKAYSPVRDGRDRQHERGQHAAGQGVPAGGRTAGSQALLGFSEQLVNTLNERARHDALRVFQREVDSMEQRIAKIQDQLTAYRVKEKMLDPKSAATGPIELVAQMNAQLANAKGAACRGPEELAEQSADPAGADPHRLA